MTRENNEKIDLIDGRKIAEQSAFSVMLRIFWKAY